MGTQMWPRDPVDRSGIFRCRPFVQRVTPLSGETIIVPGCPSIIIVTPAGTIAALTIQMPALLMDGDEVELASSQIIASLTFTGGNTVLGAPPAVPQVFGNAGFVWSEADVVWYRYR